VVFRENEWPVSINRSCDRTSQQTSLRHDARNENGFMKYTRLFVALPVYATLYTLSLSVAFALRFDLQISGEPMTEFLTWLPIVLGIKICLFAAAREWRRRHRYTSLSDVVYVSMVCLAASSLIYAVNATSVVYPGLHRSIILLDWVITVVASSVLRSAIRLGVERIDTADQAKQKLALIYGSEKASIGMLRSIRVSVPEFKIVGLIDTEGGTARSLIGGVPVISIRKGVARIAERYSAGYLLIPSSVPGTTVRDLCQMCVEAGLKAYVIPALSEIVDGRVKLTVRDVTISDLLRREPTQLDMDGIASYITDQTVLVTGAAGSIGSELCRQVIGFRPAKLILVDHSEFGMFQIEQEFLGLDTEGIELQYVIADINDQVTMGRVLGQHLPELMFHAAAYKHVPLMEHNAQIAIRNNVLGTKSAVDLADRFGVQRFVMISTDKAVRPTSVMGSTKLVAEKYLQAVAAQSSTQFITVRFGNVLNSAGSVVPTFRRQILDGGPLTVTHPEMTRFFMTIPEAVQLVLQAGAVGESGQVLILDMGEPVKIVDLAKDMIALSGLRYPEDIDIRFTGLRPGEKMYEELFYGNEKHAQKVHDKIFCAEREAIAPGIVKMHVAQLEKAVHASLSEARQTLAGVVAQYVVSDDATKEEPAVVRKVA
jgi:FlaA1/EpsC-like NDP-sugar epimerase